MVSKPTTQIIKIPSKTGFIKIGKNEDNEITLVGFSGEVSRELKDKINENMHLLLSKENPIIKTNAEIITLVENIDKLTLTTPQETTYVEIEKTSINLKE